MQLLLDTCAMLWMFDGHASIPPSLRETLTDPGNRVAVSVVSVMETTVKYQLGKLPLPAPPDRLLPTLITAHGLDTIDLEMADVLELGRLPLHHRDPFDRLLIAQARARRFTLVSPDRAFAAYAVKRLWR